MLLSASRRLAIGAALSVAAAAIAAPAAAQPKALGLNIHQSTTVGLDATRDAGLGWVRIDLNWLDAQPTPAAPDFTLFDAIVDGATARGRKVLAVVGYTPAWASSGDALGDGSVNDVPAPGAYEAFVTATVEHFQGRVTHYELWNEPNLDVFFEGTAADYTERILVPGADAVHAACPTCTVVAPGLASVDPDFPDWLLASLTAAGDRIDVVSGHIYAGFQGDDLGAGTTSDSFLDRLESHRVVKAGDTVVYEGPLSYREVMLAAGAAQPFWITETGREATLGDAAEEANQVALYRNVLEAMLPRPWWTNTLFYEAFDEPNTGIAFGVVLHDDAAPGGYQAKQVMGFLQEVTAAQPAFGGDGTDCADGLDNEGDGLVDYPDDPDCTSLLDVSEGEPPGDGGLGGSGGGGGAGGGGAGPGGGAAAGVRGAGCGGGRAPGAPARARGARPDPPAALCVALALLAAVRRRSPPRARVARRKAGRA